MSGQAAEGAGVEIRLAEAGQVPSVLLVMHEAAAAVGEGIYYPDDPDFVSAHIATHGRTLLGLVDSHVAGFLIVRFPGRCEDNLGRDIGLTHADHPLVAHMESVAVLPRYWGLGLQRQLVETAESQLLHPPLRWSMCTVAPGNHASLRNFQQLGYAVVKTTLKYGGHVRHVMLKELR